jgi:peptidoglycan/xylan/chitin deacetylase (PgdA/CDA1 family)
MPSSPPARDFRGYADRPPAVAWPGGARVAVSFVVNFEEGAETTISGGDSWNEAVYEVVDRVEGHADRCIESHFEYGTRAGYWRVMDLFDRFGAVATVSACGQAADASPWLVRDAARRGHEVAAHGYRWESHGALGFTEAEERRQIGRAVAAIAAATGRAPVGWHTRSAATAATRRLLVEHGGFLYDSDDYNDDLPYYVRVGDRPHLVLPYAFDTNDMQFQHATRFVRAADFAGYVCDAYDWLVREGRVAPRMLSIGLHLRMIGRPGRIAGLEMILAHLARSGDAWLATREMIARHWWDVCPPSCVP